MIYLERLTLRKAEKELAFHRKVGAEMTARSEDYLKWLPDIEKYLPEATYWHGTGRFQYRRTDTSNHQAGAEETTDILNSIITKDGLVPHLDPWIDSGGKTVSLGTARIHSRIFARSHLHEDDSLLYELGSYSFWIRLYAKLLFFWGLRDFKSFCCLAGNICKRSTLSDIQIRASLIRKPYKSQRVISMRNLLKAEVPGSDIIGNYPVLVGIKGDLDSLFDKIPLTHKVEVRSLTTVPMRKFSHLEVPLAKVQETKDLLRQSGIDLPVLPLEMVDLYVSQTPLSELAYT